MARPRKKIDKKQFESLCAIQCTKAEICSFFDVSDKTLEKWCRRTYQNDDGEPMGFSEVFSLKRGRGKVSLRRAQWIAAEKGNASLLIWLGKQWLNQHEPEPAPEEDEQEDDGFLDALKGEAAEAWADDE